MPPEPPKPPEPSSILRWAFYTPARLAGVCLVVVGIVVGGVLLARSQTAAPTPRATQGVSQPAPRPVARLSTPTETATHGDADGSVPTERVPSAVRSGISRSARAFVEAWARDAQPQRRARWLREIRPLTTPSLYQGLRVTDPARLPRGHVRHVDLQEAGPFAGTAVVVLTRIVRVEVRLVAERGGWLVADIRPVGP